MMTITLHGLDQFLDSLELPPSPGALDSTGETSHPGIASSVDRAAGFVIDGNLVAFTADLHGQHREDVIESVLFASLAAQACHPREEDPAAWINAFRDVLQHIGWATRSFGMTREVGVDESAIVDQVILAAGAGGQASQARRTVESFGQTARRALGYAPDFHLDIGAPLEAGRPSTLSLATATSRQGVPELTLAMARWHGWMVRDAYRGIGVAATLADVKLSTGQLALNESIYATVRQQIRDKLGPARTKDVAELWPEGPRPEGGTVPGC